MCSAGHYLRSYWSCLIKPFLFRSFSSVLCSRLMWRLDRGNRNPDPVHYRIVKRDEKNRNRKEYAFSYVCYNKLTDLLTYRACLCYSPHSPSAWASYPVPVDANSEQVLMGRYQFVHSLLVWLNGLLKLYYKYQWSLLSLWYIWLHDI